jgi:transposase
MKMVHLPLSSHPFWSIPANPQSSRPSSGGQTIFSFPGSTVGAIVDDGLNIIHHGGPIERLAKYTDSLGGIHRLLLVCKRLLWSIYSSCKLSISDSKRYLFEIDEKCLRWPVSKKVKIKLKKRSRRLFMDLKNRKKILLKVFGQEKRFVDILKSQLNPHLHERVSDHKDQKYFGEVSFWPAEYRRDPR